MAKLRGNILFTGGLDNVSAYKMRGSDKVILRTKGGASKGKIKTADCFARTRELNKEWEGCSKAGKAIRQAVSRVRLMADYNISGPLNAIAKNIQTLDGENVKGRRSICFSKHKEILEGFSFNIQNLFDGVVRSPLNYTLNRYSGSAAVVLPELIPKINFQNRDNNPLFRFVAALGIISDMEYNADYSVYRPVHREVHGLCFGASVDWQSAQMQFPKQTLEIAIREDINLEESDVLILSVGIEFGTPLTGSLVEPVKYSGSAKILVTG